ncbi:MAG: 3-hydroxyacyl-CoA dehydrogenase [Myxococcales bacterium FL481]|nr:MAG: 3-hydroxyacyl-CoA dehydrogenase [Myxococcales bacterium FL481]
MSLNLPPHQIVATVLGAGTMGAQIAAHLANAGCRVHLLDVVPAGATGRDRSGLAARGLKQLAKTTPPPLMLGEFSGRITAGNLEDDLETAVSASDLVIEAVVERLDVKRELFAKVAAASRADAVLATNTSGIPVGDIAEALPEAARERFVGLHFFNPPRFMHLLEVVPSRFTAPGTVAAASAFCERALGKGVVLCRDTPNFIGNRIGIAEMLLTFAATTRHGLSVEQVDLLNGKLMGRPKTGSFRLGDMVGLDVVAHVVDNLRTALSGDSAAPNYDPLYDQMVLPEMIGTMLSRNMAGDKAGGGFYRKGRDAAGKRTISALDLETLEYRESTRPRFDELKQIARTPRLEARIAAALRAEGKPGEFLRDVYLPLFNYAAHLTGTICETPQQIDDAMCWGFGWKLGPFALWDAAGLGWAAEAIEARGDTLAPLAKELLETEQTSWYGGNPGARTVFVGGSPAHRELPLAPGVIQLDALRDTSILDKNPTANLIDLGDGIACLEFRSKMNTLDEGVLRMLGSATDTLLERGDFRGLVIGSQSGDFSAGANLLQILGWINQKKFDEIESGVKLLQDTFMGLQHAALPVVAAPYGRTLGGGVELSLHCDEIEASAELYMGLVEIGVGLLPAGGGLKEVCRRASAWARQVPDPDPYPFVRRGFENAAMAKVSTSAFEARQMGLLSPGDGVTFHRDHLLAAAKRRCIALAERGYTPPDPHAPIDVVGAPRGASFMLGAQLFEWGGYASEHDKLIGRKIARVLSGGMPIAATTVTAQTLLDLEREAFVSLCGEAKTAARIMHMLEHNKPLRN